MATETLRPNGAGTYTQLKIGGTSPAPTNWQSVDEAVADDDITYVYNETGDGGQRDSYALPAHAGSGTINHVKVYARFYIPVGGGTKILVRTHTSNYEYTKAAGAAWQTFSETLVNNPNTDDPWTWDEIDALEIGCRLEGGFSVSANTNILMADGNKKRAGDIKIGDNLIGFDTDKKIFKNTVVKKISQHSAKYLKINGVLKISLNQIIFANNAFINSAQLKIGDILLNQKGKEIRIKSLVPGKQNITVCSFILSKPNTFFADGYLLHNVPVGKNNCTQVYAEVDYTEEDLFHTPSDTVNISDNVVFKHELNLADTLTISDSMMSFLKTMVALSDSVNIDDSISLKHLMALLDNIAISDSIMLAIKRIIGIHYITFKQTVSKLYTNFIPNADGCHIDLTPVGAANNWDCVNDPVATPDEDATYVKSTATDLQYDLYELPNHTTESGTINYTRIYSRSKVKSQREEGDYIDSWSLTGVNADPYGVTTDGTNIWTVDAGTDKVYKYNMTGGYITSWSLTNPVTPTGIATNGTNIWVIDGGANNVRKYDMDGNYISVWSVQDNDNRGITTDGTNIWTVDYSTEKIYKYDMDGNYINSWDSIAESHSPKGIATDGTNIWVVDSGTDKVYKYDMIGGYIDSWSLTGVNADPYGVTTDGTNIWTVDAGTDKVYKYAGIPNITYQTFKLILTDNNCANIYKSDNKGLIIDYTTHDNIWTENPRTLTAWTWYDFDNLQIGIECSSPTIGENELEIRTTQCYAKVNYSTYYNMIAPENVSTDHAQNIKEMNMWNGERIVFGESRSKWSLLLKGRDWESDACSKISAIKQLGLDGLPIAISGLGNPNWDTEWMIKSIGWKLIYKKPLHYEWIILLEKT